MCWAFQINILNLSEKLYEVDIIIPILQMRSVRLREVKGGKPDWEGLASQSHPDVAEAWMQAAPIHCYGSSDLAVLFWWYTTTMPRPASCPSGPEAGAPTPLLLKKKENVVWECYLLLKSSPPEEETIQEAKACILECLVILERWLQSKNAGSRARIPEFKSSSGHLTHYVTLGNLLNCSVSQIVHQ